jgi:hypothetical protein
MPPPKKKKVNAKFARRNTSHHRLFSDRKYTSAHFPPNMAKCLNELHSK